MAETKDMNVLTPSAVMYLFMKDNTVQILHPLQPPEEWHATTNNARIRFVRQHVCQIFDQAIDPRSLHLLSSLPLTFTTTTRPTKIHQ